MRRLARAFDRFRRFAPVGACAVISLFLAHCSTSNIDSRYGVAASPRVIDPGEPVPKGGGKYELGQPYVVGGRMYVPQYDPHYKAVGLASWYGDDFHGRYTANGEIFDINGISAAHPTMPLPSYARVTNLQNGRSLIVRVNDRGPYAANRIIDLSMRAAHLLGFYNQGTAMVRVDYVGPAPLRGSDDAVLASTLRENEPAPLPGRVRLAAARPIAPASPPAPAGEMLASAAPRYAPADPPEQPYSPADSPPLRGTLPAASQQMSYADAPEPPGMDGTAQYLNGRGLY